MIDSVIVTVKIDNTNKEFDLELPAKMPINELSEKLIVTLDNIQDDLLYGVKEIKLKYDIEKRFLEDDETLEDAGIWDGSYLTLIKVV